MQPIEASPYLAEIFDRPRAVYLHVCPENPDFTVHAPCKIVLIGGQKRVEIDLDRENASTVLGLLGMTAFNKEQTSSLLTWNLKALLSYFRFYIDKKVEITSPILDLHVIENFLGVKKPAPSTLVEAVARAKDVAAYKSWKTVYNTVHLPLVTRVLPTLETYAILDESARCARYAHYEIEGQRNGRLLCSKRFEKGYLPHTIGADMKANLKPRGYNLKFLLADIRHCEVSVLQWLSRDDDLGAIIDSGEDLYREIYHVITEDDCNSDKKRNMAKRMFLPVLYGCGARTLAEAMEIPENVAHQLIRRIHARFPTCCEWLEAKQQLAADDGEVTDYFGRPRRFPDKPYTARNFVVQGVAATVCLEKLIGLHYRLANNPARLCFSIHDGYGIVSPKDRCPEIATLVHEVLESPSQLCPGLSLKAEIKAGERLDELAVI